jgi:glycosyltransferase involved in cell wall biosynthesis
VKVVSLVVPGPLASRTGGSIYDSRLAEGLRARSWTVSVVELDPFVHPLAPPLVSASAQFTAIPDGSVVLVDGLAFGTMPEVIEHESRRLRFVPIIHMALSTTPALTRGESAWLGNLERRALTHARHVVVTGARTRAIVAVMIDRVGAVTRIPPGVDPVVLPADSRVETKPLRLLCVANLTWGKGYDILLRALATSPVSDWTLTCVGSAEREPESARRIRTMAAQLGLDNRIRWAGELGEAVTTEFERADLFVLPTRGETYGMAVAEAISHGVPVVSTRTGEIPSIVGDGGLLAEPGDAGAFASVMRDALGSADTRQRLATGARLAASRLPTWTAAADAMDSVLNEVTTHG